MLVKFVAKLHKPRMFCFAATLIADSHLHQHLINYWYWSLDFRYSITLEGGRDDPFFGVFIFFSIQAVNWRFLSRNFTELLFQSENSTKQSSLFYGTLLKRPQVNRTFAWISTKVHWNKERNSRISLALLLHSTVHLIFVSRRWGEYCWTIS